MGLPNEWIVKPAQGSRGFGHKIISTESHGKGSKALTSIASAAPQLSSLLSTSYVEEGGDCTPANNKVTDKVAQLLVSRPLLLREFKFDLRVIVIMRSFEPFDGYMCNLFYARLANKPYDAKNLSDNEVALTVNCYNEDDEIASRQMRMNRAEIKDAMMQEYPWIDFEIMIVGQIESLLSELFSGVASSVGNWPSSSAYYAVDIIFDTEPSTEEVAVESVFSSSSSSLHHQFLPVAKLLEVNYMGGR